MENPKVCVLMPVYNGSATVKLALKSLLNQSYKNWVCVIVNDGSKDNTKEILDSLKDSRFLVYHLPQNKGRGYARQFALEHAEGDYITFLDSDDFFHEKKIETQLKLMLSDSTIDLVASEVLVYDDNFVAVGKRTKINCDKTFHKFGNPLPISMPTSMIKLEKAKKIKYNPNLDAGEDVDFLSRYLNGGYYQHIPYPYYYYYVSNTNTPYKKILHYTANEFKRGAFMFKKGIVKGGLRVMTKSTFKWLVYAVVLPFVGENFFLKRRNKPINDNEKDEFNRQLSKTKNQNL